MDRRSFLQSTVLASLATSIPKWLQAAVNEMPLPMERPNPIGIVSQATSLEFNGDDISRPHDILWDKGGYMSSKGGIPAISERVPLIVVGGGIAGLSAAFLLRDLNPILLEQAPQFGGNSKGEQIGNTRYSTGAAYLVKPDEGSEIEAFLKALSLDTLAREEASQDLSVLYQNKVHTPFWDGRTDPAAALDFKRVQNVFKEILENQYPDIPLPEDSQISPEVFKEWDNMNFKEWLTKTFDSVHPHVEEYLQLYAWSSFCASLDEISAAQMLNFITAEMGSVLALPGGNGAIAEKIYDRLNQELGSQSLRNSCFVLDVAPHEDGVRVVYEDMNRKLKSVLAKACVFASPKYVAAKVVTGLSAEQEQAIRSLTYRAYLVANVILKKKITSPTYDLYSLKGEVPGRPVAMNPSLRQFTDVCFGSWAQEPDADRGVITVYKALPFDGARQFLFSPFAHDKNKMQIESQIPEILKALSLTERDVDGIRMTRWGHALPLAQVGALTNGLAEKASRSVGSRIFFANQDNWLNPSFEAAFGAAQAAAVEIRKIVAEARSGERAPVEI